MTDRSNDVPSDDGAPTTDELTVDEVAEEAPDLTDAQLEDAAEAARDEVEEAAATGESIDEIEATDPALEAELEAEEAAAVAAAPKLGARARAEEEARRRREARERREMREEKRGRFGRRVREEEDEDEHRRAPTRTPFAIDPALRIKDPASSGFVVATILTFLLIFLSAMAFGKGGAFTVKPTRAPVVSASPGPSINAGPSGSPGPAASPAITVAPSPLASPAPNPSAAPAS